MNTKNKTRSSHKHDQSPDFHGASIIDERGREIPITESMVRKACNDLIMAWENLHRPPSRMKVS